MARLKKVYTDPEYARDKKRDQIRKAVGCVFAAFWIVGLGFLGMWQDNRYAVGAGCVVLGIVSLAYVGFGVYTLTKKWKVLTEMDRPENWRFRLVAQETYKKQQKEIKALRIFSCLGFTAIGVFCLVYGILRLTGV